MPTVDNARSIRSLDSGAVNVYDKSVAAAQQDGSSGTLVLVRHDSLVLRPTTMTIFKERYLRRHHCCRFLCKVTKRCPPI